MVLLILSAIISEICLMFLIVPHLLPYLSFTMINDMMFVLYLTLSLAKIAEFLMLKRCIFHGHVEQRPVCIED